MRRFTPIGVVTLLLAMAATLAPPSPATPHPPDAGAGTRPHGRAVMLSSPDSANWSGMSQGTLGELVTQVSGEWTVPSAKPHEPGQWEASSTWVGIGGGCVDASCTSIDGTLIQAGTEQEVGEDGRASYWAWWEILPLPAIEISDFEVTAGDRMFVDIREVATGTQVWRILVQNKTTGEEFTKTVPYTSARGSVEWIVETPLFFGADGAGLTAMPELSPVRFDNARKNGQPVRFSEIDKVRLVDDRNAIVAMPSNPDAERDGFHGCTWTTTCPAPNSV